MPILRTSTTNSLLTEFRMAMVGKASPHERGVAAFATRR
jgi:hypothetical protein